MCEESWCHSFTAASERRLTSIQGNFYQRAPAAGVKTWSFRPHTRQARGSAGDDVDEATGHDDLLDHLGTVELCRDQLVAARQLEQRVGTGLL